MGKSLGCLGVLVLAVIVMVGLVMLEDGKGNRDAHFRTLAAALRTRTTPPSREVSDLSPTTWTQFSARASWDVEAEQSWPRYAEWTASQLTPEYRQRLASETELLFTKHVPGDAYSVTLVKLSDGPPLRVRITFHAMAD